MKIRYAPYTLKGLSGFLNREGSLLEFTFEDQSIGYADCHPWPELGDQPIEEQVSLLRTGSLTPITTRSLDFAMLDASGRSQSKNLFDGLKIPESHYLAVTASIPEEFSIIKCKDPKVCLDLLPKLNANQKVRMDFNFKLTPGKYIEFVSRVKPYLHKFDFIEDPFPFNFDTWTAFAWQFGIPLALDRAKNEEKFPVRVVKPAIDPPVKPTEEVRYIYTSYLDHPLGQIASAYVAALSGTTEVCGLATHLVYQPNVFSTQLEMDGSYLKVPRNGGGFGFSECLKEQRWQVL